jgi:hypothetical protein
MNGNFDYELVEDFFSDQTQKNIWLVAGTYPFDFLRFIPC